MKPIRGRRMGGMLVLLFLSGIAFAGDSLDETRQKAEQGDGQAQYSLGVALMRGDGMEANPEEGVGWLLKATIQTIPEANRELAYAMAYGNGIKQDCLTAITLFIRAWELDLIRGAEDESLEDYYAIVTLANTGWGGSVSLDLEPLELHRKAHDTESGEILRKLAMHYINVFPQGAGEEEGLRLLRLAVEKGDTEAYAEIGRCYELGKAELPASLTEAVKWYNQGAEKGDGQCLLMLGVRHLEGTGVAQDMGEAVRLFTLAAEKGVFEGFVRLGDAYLSGSGRIEPDENEALKWYLRAAENGEAMAMWRVGRACQYGQGTREDLAEALKWYRRGARAGDAGSMTCLAYCYEWGLGVEEDRVVAASLYARSERLNDDRARGNLAYAYAVGEGVEQNVEVARRLYRTKVRNSREADWWDEEGEFCRAAIDAAAREGGEPDVRPLTWYRLANEFDDPEAAYQLARVFEKGLGSIPSPEKARQEYEKAASLGHEKAREALRRIEAGEKGFDLEKTDTERARK